MTDEKFKVILDTPKSLNPEDLSKLMPKKEDAPNAERKFLGADFTPFANEHFVGFEIKWGVENCGWGGVTFSRCIKSYERDGHVYAKEGEWGFDSECMSEEFVTDLIRFIAPEMAKQFMQMEAGEWTPPPLEEWEK
jgi:hypothetical protein